MRKNKAEGVTEGDMEHVVHAHNTLNELTWERVRGWEALHAAACPDARLLRFLGRPDELSPLARLRTALGGPAPFDRHDWYVDRCGREVRYVIDFYFDDARAGESEGVCGRGERLGEGASTWLASAALHSPPPSPAQTRTARHPPRAQAPPRPLTSPCAPPSTRPLPPWTA